MANYVRCVLRMEGVTDLPIFSRDEEGRMALDFNTIDRQPESLDIESGVKEDRSIGVLAAMLQVYTVGSPIHRKEVALTDSDRELALNGLKYAENIVRHGFATWYGWRRAHWGTKWNAMYAEENEDRNTVRFDVANSAPLPAIRKLAAMYPGREITLSWADEDIGSNTGVFHIDENGEEDISEFMWRCEDALETYVDCWRSTEGLAKVDGRWAVEDED